MQEVPPKEDGMEVIYLDSERQAIDPVARTPTQVNAKGLLQEVHAAEEGVEARRARPHREAVGQRTSRIFVIAC